MAVLGKGLMIVGGVLLVVGAILVFFQKIPFLGKLPGDIHIKKEHYEVYIPLATSLLLSAVVSLIFWLISSFRNK